MFCHFIFRHIYLSYMSNVIPLDLLSIISALTLSDWSSKLCDQWSILFYLYVIKDSDVIRLLYIITHLPDTTLSVDRGLKMSQLPIPLGAHPAAALRLYSSNKHRKKNHGVSRGWNDRLEGGQELSN